MLTVLSAVMLTVICGLYRWWYMSRGSELKLTLAALEWQVRCLTGHYKVWSMFQTLNIQ